MKHRIVYADELAQEARRLNLDWALVSESVQRQAMAEHPVYLGMITSVTYDTKTDRYVVKFGQSSAKLTDDTAEYLLTHVFSVTTTARPTVYAHMTKGTIDSVLLLYLSR